MPWAPPTPCLILPRGEGVLWLRPLYLCICSSLCLPASRSLPRARSPCASLPYPDHLEGKLPVHLLGRRVLPEGRLGVLTLCPRVLQRGCQEDWSECSCVAGTLLFSHSVLSQTPMTAYFPSLLSHFVDADKCPMPGDNSCDLFDSRLVAPPRSGAELKAG